MSAVLSKDEWRLQGRFDFSLILCPNHHTILRPWSLIMSTVNATSAILNGLQMAEAKVIGQINATSDMLDKIGTGTIIDAVQRLQMSAASAKGRLTGCISVVECVLESVTDLLESISMGFEEGLTPIPVPDVIVTTQEQISLPVNAPEMPQEVPVTVQEDKQPITATNKQEEASCIQEEASEYQPVNRVSDLLGVAVVNPETPIYPEPSFPSLNGDGKARRNGRKKK